ncbi:hypothetical protein SLEP1_g18282 [Rubroshorea leprosula]|uniref:Uncharacterized protein n=2 Tax=Rubroshorea leprosula TaxID=152421 RepID=A0AAV5IWW9_9ROSI|nr:hypothetical protein SLEP1_g18282 [Rubroshorea leprosula]
MMYPKADSISSFSSFQVRCWENMQTGGNVASMPKALISHDQLRMAYAGTLRTRTTCIARRCQPSFASTFAQHRSFGAGLSNTTVLGGFFREGRRSHFPSLLSNSFSSYRYMSTSIGVGSDKIWLMCDAVEVLKDTTVKAMASLISMVNKVARAAVDSFLPAVLHHFISRAHWLADLTTTCSSYTLPILTVLTFLIRIEPQLKRIRDARVNRLVKIMVTVFVTLQVALVWRFPKVILYYWITENMVAIFNHQDT